MIQEIRHNADLEPYWNISNQATSSSDVYQRIEGSVLESKEFALQEQIDRLQEQMKIRDSEIDGLKARYYILQRFSLLEPSLFFQTL